MPRSEPDPISHIEREIALLARLLEGLGRQQTYPLDRAHYLLLLQLEDGPLSINELATRLALDSTTVTRQVRAMELRGLVGRADTPDDRRVTLIGQTKQGADCVDAMRRMRTERLRELFCDWTDDDKARFADMLERCNGALHARLSELMR